MPIASKEDEQAGPVGVTSAGAVLAEAEGREVSMTESEWLSCPWPYEIIFGPGVRGSSSDRKRRLFLCACCRAAWPVFVDERSRQAITVAERYADSDATSAELKAAWTAADEVSQLARRSGTGWEAADAAAATAVTIGPDPPGSWAWPTESVITSITQAVANSREAGPRTRASAWHTARDREIARTTDLAREIQGNPFRPVTVAAGWLTVEVVSLARAAYDERNLPVGQINPARLSVLSDALEEAGCTDATILSHLRSPGPHVRGCWTLDLLLAKE